MIKVVILNKLRDEIYKTFKKNSLKVYSLMEELQTHPQKGKVLGHVGSISIRELKYGSYRLYCVLDGHRLFLFTRDQTVELLIRFVAMSKKHNQQQTIDEIKRILTVIGPAGFE